MPAKTLTECYFCKAVWGSCRCKEVPEEHGFEFDDFTIVDPSVDESGRFFVDPVAYYGSAFTKWRKHIAEKVNGLWKKHAAMNGPREPWTNEDKATAIALMPWLEPEEFLTASGAYRDRGASWAPVPKFPRIKFGFDDPEPTFEGYDSGQRWNGWLCPLVTREGLDKVMTYFNEAAKAAPKDVRTYKLKGDVLFEKDPTDTNRWHEVGRATEAETVDGKFKVWDIGLGLVWTRAEEK